MVIRCKHFPPLPYQGISIFGMFIFRKECIVTTDLITHEQIHLKQQQEWLFIGFFILYAVEFIYYFIKTHNWDKAYNHISFEREAYANMHSPTYPATRRHFSNYINTSL